MVDDGDRTAAQAWPSDVDIEELVRDAAEAPDGESGLSSGSESDLGPEVSGITSHELRCGTTVVDMSTFRPRFTDQYRARVALYDRRGARIYLSPFRDKGGANAYKTLIHQEYVLDPHKLTHRGLVIWIAVNDGRYEASWRDC